MAEMAAKKQQTVLPEEEYLEVITYINVSCLCLKMKIS